MAGWLVPPLTRRRENVAGKLEDAKFEKVRPAESWTGAASFSLAERRSEFHDSGQEQSQRWAVEQSVTCDGRHGDKYRNVQSNC
jgi:hypothetical protein